MFEIPSLTPCDERLFTLIPMDGSLWLESHLKADGPKCVVLAFLCCPDPYYCLILDSQFSLFFLFFWLMIWLNLCGFMRFGGIRRGRFNFWMESRVHKWPPMVLGSLLGKKDNTTHLGPSAFKERRSFPWPLVMYNLIANCIRCINYFCISHICS